MQTVFTVYGGSVAADGTVDADRGGQLLGWVGALVFIWVLLASGSAWIMGAGRAQAAACLDGAGPRVLGRISRAHRRAGGDGPGLGRGRRWPRWWPTSAVTGGDGQKYFSAALTVSIALIVLAYLLIFPAFLALRIRRPDLERPFRVPGGPACAWLITVLATGWSLLATACLLWPGLGTADPDASLPAGFEGAAARSSSCWCWRRAGRRGGCLHCLPPEAGGPCDHRRGRRPVEGRRTVRAGRRQVSWSGGTPLLLHPRPQAQPGPGR